MKQDNRKRVNKLIEDQKKVLAGLKETFNSQKETVSYWSSKGEKAKETFEKEQRYLIPLHLSIHSASDIIKRLKQINK